MTTAVIVDAVRTPGGSRNGKLRGWHAVDLAAEPLKALVERNDLDPALVDDVIMGCVMQVGEQALNIGRNAVLAAGFPESVPATTIDRQCGSSQQALHFAAQGVMAGAYDVVIAAGVEVMTHTPMGSSVVRDLGFPFGPTVMARYAERRRPGLPGHLGRDDRRPVGPVARGARRASAPAASSSPPGPRPRAASSARSCRSRCATTRATVTDEIITADEGIRPDTTVEVLANLKPAFKPDGKVTAGNSSQITDGASAVLIMSEEKANALGLTPGPASTPSPWPAWTPSPCSPVPSRPRARCSRRPR